MTKRIKRLPANIRVMIAMVASPTLFAFFYIGYSLYIQEPQQISIAVIVFGMIGLFAYFVAFAGRLPFKKTWVED